MLGYAVPLLLSALFFVASNSAICSSSPDIVILPPPCTTYLCSATGTPVYATLNGECEKFSNGCNLGVANCIRQENNQTDFWTTVMECPKQCPTVCPFIFSPVCATNGCEFKTFGNGCLLNVYNCENNAKYVAFSNQTCPDCPAKPHPYPY